MDCLRPHYTTKWNYLPVKVPNKYSFFHISAFAYFVLQSTSLSGQADEANKEPPPQPPPIIFSAMLWGEQGFLTSSYAPWDNHEEENSTILPISIASGVVSKKYAYYGGNPLRFLEVQDLSEDEFETESNSSLKKPPPRVLASCNFTLTDGQTKEYILLVAPNKGDEEGTAKIYAIPFDQENIPTGSFAFSSRSNQTLYIEFGKNRFAVPPRNSIVKKAQVKENSRIIPLKVFLKKAGEYETVLSKEWPHSDTLRGLVYLTETPSGIEVTRIADFPQSVEQTLGYGSRPTITPPKKPRTR